MVTLLWLLLALSPQAAEPRLKIVFEAMEPEHAAAAAGYTALWKAEGARIIDALEKRSGLRFEARDIRALVIEAPSSSGFGATPMRLRASSPADTRKGTLIHELGHRLQSGLFRRGEEDHPFLFLYLYDVWSDLYGTPFADAQVQVESARKGLSDYEKAWKQVLMLSPDERVAAWRNFVASRTARSGN
ncbi:MAG: hypothetical protein M3R55_11815 [Acidobacteriota bacterium]|nr:hypothetical protein [Acidobacteriota bacterium]